MKASRRTLIKGTVAIALFDALDKATQDALLKAAAEAETRGWKLSEEKTGWYTDQLKKNGMNVALPSPQLKRELGARRAAAAR